MQWTNFAELQFMFKSMETCPVVTQNYDTWTQCKYSKIFIGNSYLNQWKIVPLLHIITNLGLLTLALTLTITMKSISNVLWVCWYVGYSSFTFQHWILFFTIRLWLWRYFGRKWCGKKLASSASMNRFRVLYPIRLSLIRTYVKKLLM